MVNLFELTFPAKVTVKIPSALEPKLMTGILLIQVNLLRVTTMRNKYRQNSTKNGCYACF